MAAEAVRLYLQFVEGLDAGTRALVQTHQNPFLPPTFQVATSVEESKRVTARRAPTIVVSASGMATGGRVLHHLEQRLPDPRNTVILVGFQAAGTRGRRLLNGEPQVKMHGRMVPVKAHIAEIQGLSAHADANEVLRWLGGLEHAPRRVFVVHGEPAAAATLAAKVRQQFGWEAEVPEFGMTVGLT